MATATEQADHEEIVRAAAESRPVDPEVSKRVRERAEKIREEILRTHGVLNVAVDLIREARDE
jgi:predicted anti-sigma-YlaC factor YlaD